MSIYNNTIKLYKKYSRCDCNFLETMFAGVEIIYKVTVPGSSGGHGELESKMNRIAAGDAPAIVAAVQTKVAEVSGVELSEIAVTATSPTKSVVQEKVPDEKCDFKCSNAPSLQCDACASGMTDDEYCVANPNSEYCDGAVGTSEENVPLPGWLIALVIVVVVCLVVAAGVIGKKHCKKDDQKEQAEVELPAIAIGSATAMKTNPMKRSNK